MTLPAAANPATGSTLPPAVTPDTPVMLAETVSFDLLPKAGGKAFRIFVHTPPGPAPEAGWPVLYMTDGNAVIGTAVDILRAQAPYPAGTNIGHGVIVAIGYPIVGAYDPLRRSWDLCPPPVNTYPPFHAGGPDVRTGGADAFLAFIIDELKPIIQARVAIDQRRQALFGHSFGGLFALHAFYSRPDAFRTIIAASPSIAWDDFLLFHARDRFLADVPAGLDTQLLLSAGEWEGDALAPFQRDAPDAEARLAQKAKNLTVAHARDLASALTGVGGSAVTADFELFAGETHMSVLPVAVNRAIQAAFAVQR